MEDSAFSIIFFINLFAIVYMALLKAEIVNMVKEKLNVSVLAVGEFDLNVYLTIEHRIYHLIASFWVSDYSL